MTALLALAAPLMWVIHGWVHHHDALFFLHRVAAYRRALGGAEGGLSAIGEQALAVLREPELVLGGVFAVLAGRRADRALLGRFGRPAVVVGAVLAFLVAGELVGGSATHHVERTLLPVWGFLAIVGAEGALRAAGSAAFRLSLALSLGGAALAGVAIRSRAPAEALAPRTEEIAIGSVARRLVPATEAPLLVDTADYGYFAAIAAFGAPERAAPFVTHDPRERGERDPFATPNTLRSALVRRRARFLVTQRVNVPVAAAVGKIVGETPAFALVDAGPVPGLAPGFGMRAPEPEP